MLPTLADSRVIGIPDRAPDFKTRGPVEESTRLRDEASEEPGHARELTQWINETRGDPR